MPISAFSKALLSKIFQHAVEEASEKDIRSKKHPALVLSHVCRRWRSVALNSPALWTDITLRNVKARPGEGTYKTYVLDVTVPVKYDRARWQRETRFATQCAQLWLTRSQGNPLFFTFTMSNLDTYRETGTLNSQSPSMTSHKPTYRPSSMRS